MSVPSVSDSRNGVSPTAEESSASQVVVTTNQSSQSPGVSKRQSQVVLTTKVNKRSKCYKFISAAHSRDSSLSLSDVIAEYKASGGKRVNATFKRVYAVIYGGDMPVEEAPKVASVSKHASKDGVKKVKKVRAKKDPAYKVFLNALHESNPECSYKDALAQYKEQCNKKRGSKQFKEFYYGLFDEAESQASQEASERDAAKVQRAKKDGLTKEVISALAVEFPGMTTWERAYPLIKDRFPGVRVMPKVRRWFKEVHSLASTPVGCHKRRKRSKSAKKKIPNVSQEERDILDKLIWSDEEVSVDKAARRNVSTLSKCGFELANCDLVELFELEDLPKKYLNVWAYAKSKHAAIGKAMQERWIHKASEMIKERLELEEEEKQEALRQEIAMQQAEIEWSKVHQENMPSSVDSQEVVESEVDDLEVDVSDDELDMLEAQMQEDPLVRLGLVFEEQESKKALVKVAKDNLQKLYKSGEYDNLLSRDAARNRSNKELWTYGGKALFESMPKGKMAKKMCELWKQFVRNEKQKVIDEASSESEVEESKPQGLKGGSGEVEEVGKEDGCKESKVEIIKDDPPSDYVVMDCVKSVERDVVVSEYVVKSCVKEVIVDSVVSEVYAKDYVKEEKVYNLVLVKQPKIEHDVVKDCEVSYAKSVVVEYVAPPKEPLFKGLPIDLNAHDNDDVYAPQSPVFQSMVDRTKITYNINEMNGFDLDELFSIDSPSKPSGVISPCGQKLPWFTDDVFKPPVIVKDCVKKHVIYDTVKDCDEKIVMDCVKSVEMDVVVSEVYAKDYVKSYQAPPKEEVMPVVVDPEAEMYEAMLDDMLEDEIRMQEEMQMELEMDMDDLFEEPQEVAVVTKPKPPSPSPVMKPPSMEEMDMQMGIMDDELDMMLEDEMQMGMDDSWANDPVYAEEYEVVNDAQPSSDDMMDALFGDEDAKMEVLEVAPQVIEVTPVDTSPLDPKALGLNQTREMGRHGARLNAMNARSNLDILRANGFARFFESNYQGCLERDMQVELWNRLPRGSYKTWMIKEFKKKGDKRI